MKEGLALGAMAMALLLLKVSSQAVAVLLLRRLPRRRLLAAQVCTLQGQSTTKSSFVASSVRCECSRSCPRQLNRAARRWQLPCPRGLRSLAAIVPVLATPLQLPQVRRAAGLHSPALPGALAPVRTESALSEHLRLHRHLRRQLPRRWHKLTCHLEALPLLLFPLPAQASTLRHTTSGKPTSSCCLLLQASCSVNRRNGCF